MRDRESDLWKPRNPITHRKIRREVLLWITMPIAITAVIIAVLSILAIGLPAGPASVLADISLIWLLAPAILFTLIFTALTGATAYGIIRAIVVLPPFFYKAQNFTRLLSLRVNQIGNKLTGPVIKINKFGAQARAAKRETSRVARRVAGRD